MERRSCEIRFCRDSSRSLSDGPIGQYANSNSTTWIDLDRIDLRPDSTASSIREELIRSRPDPCRSAGEEFFTHPSELPPHGTINQLIPDPQHEATDHGWICILVKDRFLTESRFDLLAEHRQLIRFELTFDGKDIDLDPSKTLVHELVEGGCHRTEFAESSLAVEYQDEPEDQIRNPTFKDSSDGGGSLLTFDDR